MHPALQHRLLSISCTINKRPSRLISRRRYPLARSFHRSSQHSTPKDYPNGTGPFKDGEDEAASREDTDSPKPVAGNGHSEIALDKSASRDLMYYGSAARRQMRSRIGKEPEQPAPIQDWFVDFNVRLASNLKNNDPLSGMQILVPTPGKGYVGMVKKDFDRLMGNAPQMNNLQERIDSQIDQGPSTSPTSKTRQPVPLPGKRYFFDFAQYTEIMYTAMGLIKTTTPDFAGEVAAEKSHLILHYPEEGGSFLLDEVVEDLSRRMGCDLVVLDAQDIAELVATLDNVENSTSAHLAHAARLMSYEVYYKENSTTNNASEEEQAEIGEFEEQEDSSSTRENRMGVPVIIAKPISLDLSDLLGGSIGAQTMGRNRISKSFLSELGDESGPRPKSTRNIFSTLIDTILSAPHLKRDLESSQGMSTAVGETAPVAQPSTEKPLQTSAEIEEGSEGPAPSNGLIIHIRDLRSIQETSIGGQFLSALYDRVQMRRRSRQPVLIVGSETSTEDQPSYSKSRIQDMQKGDISEISTDIVLSPVTPNTDAKLVLLEDKKRRTRVINMRHFWEQYRQKDRDALKKLPDGFWQLDPIEYLKMPDTSFVESSVWSFGQVHRISSLVAGLAEEKPFGPSHLKRAFQHLSASDRSKFDWAEKRQTKDKRLRRSDSSDSRLNKIRNSATKYEKRLLGGVIEPSKIRTTFNDVHAPIETIDALKTLTTLSLVRPDAFLYGVLASDKIPGLLLYGPPGTGKTLLAKAVAKESGATVLEVSGAEINDMYVGEGEKNVKAVFSLAKKLSPAVIFIDEADAIFSARGGGHRRVSHRELLNQFLKEWDGMSNDSGGAFIMVATNRPMDLDDAVLRRLPRRLLVDLPTESDRLEILKIHLREEQLAEDVNLSDIASKTPFYSGSDLKNLSVAAALSCVREENELAKMHAGQQPYKHAEKRTLTAQHFVKALEEISASISEDMSSLKDIKKFDEQYGDKRGKKRAPNWGFDSAEQANKILDTVKVRA